MSENSSVKIEMDIPVERIADLLCCALEGGSNYWYTIEKFQEPNRFEYKCFPDDKKPIRHIDYPMNKGGFIIVSDRRANDDADEKDLVFKKIDLESMKEGLAIMSKKYPRHFNDFMCENDDADTGDVFLQCCVFGELVYG